MTSILQLHHKTTSSFQYLIPILLLNFVQISILLKYSLMTKQIFVQLSSKTPQNMLQHYLQDILDTLKFQLLMKNPNSSKLMILTLLIHNVTTHTYHPEITEPVPQTNYIVQYDDPTTLLLNSPYIKFI